MLYSRIAQTIAWCRQILHEPNWRPDLRTESLRPILLHDGIDLTVCDTGRSREWRIRPRVQDTQIMPDLAGGRLMIFYPDANLTDGSAAEVSERFFDDFNIPPWDTWISFFVDNTIKPPHNSRYLLAYVPVELIELADHAIRINPEECIVWLDQTEFPLKNRLTS